MKATDKLFEMIRKARYNLIMPIPEHLNYCFTCNKSSKLSCAGCDEYHAYQQSLTSELTAISNSYNLQYLFDDLPLIGYESIDDDHRLLVILANKCFDELRGNNREEIVKAFKNFCDFTKSHFVHEEVFMLTYEYPLAYQHIQQHNKAITELQSIMKNINYINDGTITDTINFIKFWFSSHVINDDILLGKFILDINYQ